MISFLKKYALLLGPVLSGILLGLSWPTDGWEVLIFFAFVPLLLSEQILRESNLSRKGLKVWGMGYLAFFMWNFYTTGWLYYSSGFGMWFAVLVNSALMATVFWLFYRVSAKSKGVLPYFFLVSLWLCFEWMHLHWEFSWPWLNLGNVFSDRPDWVQWYAYTGAFGGSLWVWIVNVLLFYGGRAYVLSPKGRLGLSYPFAVLLIVLPIILSYWIKRDYQVDKTTPVDVVVLQPNIDPYVEKYDTGNKDMVERLDQLVAAAITPETDLVVAPETTLADGINSKYIDRDQDIRQLKSNMAIYPGVSYLGGVSLGYAFRDKSQVTAQSNYVASEQFYYNDYNSAMFFTGRSNTQVYHKSKLVVGVENFPYKGFLQPLLGDVMLDLGGTVATKTTQDQRAVFDLANEVKAAPAICYESVYGDFVTGFVRNGAGVITVITNDAWWGNTQGHQQHLAFSRLRAIENRRFVVRSANTGISAIVNPLGEITQQLGYEEEGSFAATVYAQEELTFYTRYGDYIARMALMIMMLSLFALLFYKKKSTD